MTPETGSVEEISELLRTIAHPTRLRILRHLMEGDACVTELSAKLDVPMPYVSHQLRLLRNAHLVRRYRGGGRMYYGLTSVPGVALVLEVLRFCPAPDGGDAAARAQRR
ncbi:MULTISPECIES: metalloregulator ArsR/SmtB family transcription factor [unclassified Micromonospora]|uniref:ArsR/SmtB family transcription factor n=1 Tax=unclassified Micromonospora TaxID=2617518 RepID=UPI001C220558|nr:MULTISPECIES: metalloregulator ArsR/SmtB family transcription factor [unclassified Micromonospora]MBU8861537.1 metalloregulator ArsR/SmtB family transcription factor [Micromonospora sp. WMMB482]MDM4781105.1 metalloregulator ArsR/SmtB family transcription factor [Micromonospora sp. b486]